MIDPETIAFVHVRPKLQKRLRLCLHSVVPWTDAPKSHRQLRELGLVYLGDTGDGEVALATPEGQQLIQMFDDPGAHGLSIFVDDAQRLDAVVVRR